MKVVLDAVDPRGEDRTLSKGAQHASGLEPAKRFPREAAASSLGAGLEARDTSGRPGKDLRLLVGKPLGGSAGLQVGQLSPRPSDAFEAADRRAPNDRGQEMQSEDLELSGRHHQSRRLRSTCVTNRYRCVGYPPANEAASSRPRVWPSPTMRAPAPTTSQNGIATMPV